MATKTKKGEPSTYRGIMEKVPFKMTSMEFSERGTALQYVHELADNKTAWYGVYEINPVVNHLISIEQKRLIPHDDRIMIRPKETSDKPKLHRQNHRKK
jgi:hypothetical protein